MNGATSPLVQAAAWRPEHPALVDFRAHRTVSYRELDRLVRDVADCVQAAEFDGPVGLVLAPSWRTVVHYCGLCFAGAEVILLEPLLRPEELANLLVVTGAAALFAEGDVLRRIRSSCPGRVQLVPTDHMGDPTGAPSGEARCVWRTAQPDQPNTCEPPERAWKDLAECRIVGESVLLHMGARLDVLYADAALARGATLVLCGEPAPSADLVGRLGVTHVLGQSVDRRHDPGGLRPQSGTVVLDCRL